MENASLPVASQDTEERLETTAGSGEQSVSSGLRLQTRGKFFFSGGEKLYVRGVTYGAFRPNENQHQFPDLTTIDRDFAAMAANGINSVRIYTPPPPGLLDIALRHGLRVMISLSAELYAGYLVDTHKNFDIRAELRSRVRACAGHPAVWCYALGNEIPAQLVRLIGPRRVERYLKKLWQLVKAEDPEALVTYVNYPTTEYLILPFLDFLCFNVYLESRERLEAYLGRLQNLAGDRPLVLSEIGLDSRRNGVHAQAQVLDWQLRASFSAGAAGCYVYAWTDEWYSRGEDVQDWDFGITSRNREPKPALASVRAAYDASPFPAGSQWPRVSVAVCTYNGRRTIRDCLDGLARLAYPNVEVIVIDDGSTDGTADIVRDYGVCLIQTENLGLSIARNRALEEAEGEIIAYLDDDAYPDPQWLHYLVQKFQTTDFMAVGGPNLAPLNEGHVAQAIANAPGGPNHVLLSDSEAEHIPGCNMAFRSAALRAIGGFDPQFRAAGDDVDICWRIQQAGWKVGFHPAALVWHHRRKTLGAYWRQQLGYGQAEAMLEVKWPEKYNAAGHITWSGRVYGKGLARILVPVRYVYQGVWGLAPFQSLYEPAAGAFRSLPLMPEWYLVITLLAGLCVLGIAWSPLLWALPFLILAIGATLGQAVVGAADASYHGRLPTRLGRVGIGSLTVFFHLIQPLARLVGRMHYGLTPWRPRNGARLLIPHARRSASLASGAWESREQKLTAVETALRRAKAVIRRNGDFDRWDLEVQGGLLGGARVLLSVEDLSPGTQLIRSHSWPHFARWGLVLMVIFAGLAGAAGAAQAWLACGVLGLAGLAVGFRAFREATWAQASILRAVQSDIQKEV
jgi:O-antigen biosynthesis protein